MRIYVMMALCLVLPMLSSCSLIEEGECRTGYILYQYRNNIGADASDQIFKMTDFIFTKDSVLYRVDDDITGGRKRRRPIDLPDGEWLIVTYGNLGVNSRMDYTVGTTRFPDISLRVVSPAVNRGESASTFGDIARQGDSDPLYYGKVAVKVSGGMTNRQHVVDMSNVHIRLSATVRWKNRAEIPTRSSNLHVRLEYVPVAHSLLSDDKVDAAYAIGYSTPRISDELASHVSGLYGGNNENEFTFSACGLRWETGRIPVLRLYNGDTPLVDKDLPLEKYFSENRLDLTNTRVQFYELLIEIDKTSVVISDLRLEDWEDGGFIN